MIEIQEEIEKRNLKSKMLLQVHDELIFNVLKEEQEEVKAIVKDIMENGNLPLNRPKKPKIRVKLLFLTLAYPTYLYQ